MALLRDEYSFMDTVGKPPKFDGFPRRYGIIPCSRCAYWCLPPHGDDEDVTVGQCRRHPAVFPATEEFNRIYNQEQRDEFTGFWPATCSDEGCGDGLLREEAAPLPEEPKP